MKKITKYLLHDQVGAFYAHWLRGLLNLNYQDYQSAIFDFNYLIEKNPRDPMPYCLRSSAYYLLKKQRKADIDLFHASLRNLTSIRDINITYPIEKFYDDVRKEAFEFWLKVCAKQE